MPGDVGRGGRGGGDLGQAAGGQPAQGQGEQRDHGQAEPEHRHGLDRVGRGPQAPVEQTTFAVRGQRAEHEAGHQHHGEGGAHQQQGPAGPGTEDRGHRLVPARGPAQIAAQQVAHPARVLHG
jgi:hypothetical protein